MNNSINVQSPSFGMALKIKNPDKFREVASKLPESDKSNLSRWLKYAHDKLGKTEPIKGFEETAEEATRADKTKWVDLELDIDDKGKMVYEMMGPKFKLDESTGVLKVERISEQVDSGYNLAQVTDKVLEQDKIAADKYKKLKEQAEEIQKTNKELGAILDIVCD